MSRSRAFLGWLEDKSDWLSPIVVKEVRQLVRTREFNASFAGSVVAGLAVAFFGAADALAGSGTSGRWTFGALMGCLAILGLAVVPLGAFSMLRNERMEQTLELITLTALSQRRVVIGKLLAQAVKLATLFAAVAPFIAMSFLLGGIDFGTILLSLLALFMWSLWACALCLFFSTLFKSRAVSGLVFGVVGIVLFVVFGLSRTLFMVARMGGSPLAAFGVTGSRSWWWVLAITTTFCLATMANLVLLAENRLSLPTENRVTRLRVGFLVQFLLIAGWTLTFIDHPVRVRTGAIEALAVFGGLHLAVVAIFTVTEDLAVPRRVRLRMKVSSRWNWLLTMFRPGGGRGAVYVLAQMVVMLCAARLLGAKWMELRWLLTMCGYICFFTGVPTLAFRSLRPARDATLHLRVAVLLLLACSTLLPDIIHYLLWQPDVLNLSFSSRHLLNPFRTLANWTQVEARAWFEIPVAMGLAGFFSYLALIQMGARTIEEPISIDPHISAVEA